MKIKSSNFVASIVDPLIAPSDFDKEICIVGKSNVGKSSLINKILNRKSIAKVSSKPGKTKALNYFNINDEFYLIDVPGYGYAVRSKREKDKWAKFLNKYFQITQNLKVVLLLIDSRHEPNQNDLQMYNFLNYQELPIIIIATKVDKIGTTKLHKNLKIIKQKLKYPGEIIPFSINNNKYKEKVLSLIELYLDM